MILTPNQFDLLQKLSIGISWDDLSEPERDILVYFDQIQLAEPRAYIADGYYVLSETGKAVLHEELIRQNSVRKEQEEERRTLEEAIREKADAEAQRRSDQCFQVKLSFINALLPFAFGLVAGNLDRIPGILSGVVSWIADLIQCITSPV